MFHSWVAVVAATTTRTVINFIPKLFVQLLTLKYGFIALVESLTCHLYCSVRTHARVRPKTFKEALKMTGHFLVLTFPPRFRMFVAFTIHIQILQPHTLAHPLTNKLDTNAHTHTHLDRMVFRCASVFLSVCVFMIYFVRLLHFLFNISDEIEYLLPVVIVIVVVK